MSHHTSGASVVVYPPKHPRPSRKPASLGQLKKVAGERGEIHRKSEYEQDRGKEEFGGHEEVGGGRETSSKSLERHLSAPPRRENIAEREQVERTASPPESREAQTEARGKFLMQEYLRSKAKQLHLMTVCARAIAACMQCEFFCLSMNDLKCAQICRQCNAQMTPALKLLASNAPRVAEVVYLSTLLADDCVKECRGKSEESYQRCSEACKRWSETAKRALYECAEAREQRVSNI